MHGNTAIWALVVLLPYSYCQDPLNTTAATAISTADTTIPTNNSLANSESANNTSANSESANNTTNNESANNTSAINVVNTMADVNNSADSDLFSNTVGDNIVNTDNSLDNDIDTTTVVTTTTGPTEPRNCSTARDIKGVCVHRPRCDYNTPNIDLTLYAPKWYKKPCKPDEVCCPFDSLLEYVPVAFNDEAEFKDED